MAPRTKKPRDARGNAPGDAGADVAFDVPPSGSLFDNMAEDTYIEVRRRDIKTKQPVYLGRVAPDEATEEFIHEHAGGGTYHVRERLRMDDGTWTTGRGRTIYLAGEPLPANKVTFTHGQGMETGIPRRPGTGGASENGQPMTFDQAMATAMFGVVDQMRQGGEIQIKAMEAMMLRMMQPQKSIEWDKVLAIIAPVAQAMLTREPKPDVDVLAVVRQVAELLKVDKSLDPVKQLREHMGLMGDWFDLKSTVKGEEDDPVYGMVKEYMPKLLDIIKAEQAEKGRMPTEEEVQRRLTAGQTGTVPATTRPNVPLWAQVLLKYKRELLTAAAQGDDGRDVADAVARLLPNQVIGSVLELLRAEDNGAKVISVVPELGQYPTWTTDFLTGLWENLKPEEEEEEEEEEEGSDTEEEADRSPPRIIR